MTGHRPEARLVDELAAALREAGTPERAAHEKAYLKSDREHYGTSVPAIRRITLDLLRSHPELRGADARPAVVALVEEAWDRGPHELRMAAVEALCATADLLLESDIDLVERLLREARTWALVDGIAPAVAWNLLSRYPRLGTRIDAWAVDADLWLRRSALLTLLLPMRQGAEVFERWTRLAEPMLADREFFVRKALGWVLRERSKSRPDEVFDWLLPRAHRASGLTVREASKRLTPEHRAALLAAHAAV